MKQRTNLGLTSDLSWKGSTYYITFSVLSLVKTDLVLVELSHTQIPLLLSHLHTSVCRLILSCCFVCENYQRSQKCL